MFTSQSPNRLTSRLRAFLCDQSGAVTVDWVVLTAALIAMVAAFFAAFTGDLGTAVANLMAMINSNI